MILNKKYYINKKHDYKYLDKILEMHRILVDG